MTKIKYHIRIFSILKLGKANHLMILNTAKYGLCELFTSS